MTEPALLITGGLGYIGSHVAAALAEAGHQNIVIVDNLANAEKSVLHTLQVLYPETTFSFYEADVRHGFVLDAVFELHTVEAVFHMAALKSVAESHVKPWDYYDVNVAGTLSLLNTMEANGCRRLVFSSSATVYGTANPPLTEETQTGVGISSPYGKTKWMVEEVLKDLADSDSRWRIQVLRYFNPIGAHPSGLLGEDPMVANNLFPILLRVCAGMSPDPITVFGIDWPTADGTCERDYIDVWDLARAHVGTLGRMHSAEAESWEAHNVGTGTPISVLELLVGFEEATGVYVPVLMGERRQGDLASLVATVADDTGKKLGGSQGPWKPEVSLAESCQRGWAFMCRDIRQEEVD